MKKILITGANSYIGVSFENYIKANYPDEYTVDTVDMVDGSWREKDFSAYDAVFHVAGIAHQKETKESAELYYRINRDLVTDVASKAKMDGVKQFIFLSSMSVYGMETGVITKDTVPNPKSSYGKSKLQAEEQMAELADESFKLCTVRPPMVYGKNCRGNFQSIVKLAAKLPVFPKVNNKRSMIYIDNLASFIKMCIDYELEGVYLPQNREYVSTSDMVRVIADTLSKKLYMSYVLGFCIKLLTPFLRICRKGFGSLIYSGTEDFDYSYCVSENHESIRKSV